MSCTPISLTGISLDCGNVGGLKAVYIADISDVDEVTLTSDKISAITMVSTKKFAKFEFRTSNADFVSDSSRDDVAGTNFVETTLTAKFNHMDTDKRKDLNALTKGNTYVIAQDNNGKYWFLGYESYCGGSVNGNTGAALSDANQYQLTLTTQTVDLPYEVEASAMTSII